MLFARFRLCDFMFIRQPWSFPASREKERLHFFCVSRAHYSNASERGACSVGERKAVKVKGICSLSPGRRTHGSMSGYRRASLHGLHRVNVSTVSTTDSRNLSSLFALRNRNLIVGIVLAVKKYVNIQKLQYIT